MLQFMGWGSTLILYGLLSDKPAGGIDVIGFIGKAQTIESFVLNTMLMKMSLAQYAEFVLRVLPLYSTELTTEVNARFGLHQVKEAHDFYMKNQTAGKIIFKPSLTVSTAST